MEYFGGTDDEAESRLMKFEAAPRSASTTAIREYVDMVVSGRYARLLVRQVQKRLEEGRPWPMSFGSAEELLAHLDRIDFQLRCPTSGRPVNEEKAFWTKYEAAMLPWYAGRLPRLLEANFKLNLLAGIHLDAKSTGAGPRTTSAIETVLAGQLGNGDLITALKVAMRMVEEGIDGGVRRLRHIVLTAGLKRDIDLATTTVTRLILGSDNRQEVIAQIVRVVNESGLVSRPATELDIACFSGQYVGALIDVVSAGALPTQVG